MGSRRLRDAPDDQAQLAVGIRRIEPVSASCSTRQPPHARQAGLAQLAHHELLQLVEKIPARADRTQGRVEASPAKAGVK